MELLHQASISEGKSHPPLQREKSLAPIRKETTPDGVAVSPRDAAASAIGNTAGRISCIGTGLQTERCAVSALGVLFVWTCTLRGWHSLDRGKTYGGWTWPTSPVLAGFTIVHLSWHP